LVPAATRLFTVRSAAGSDPVAGARAWVVHVPAVGNRGDQLVVRAHGEPCRWMEFSGGKTKTRETEPAGVLCVGRAQRPSNGDVEEHSGGERGLVHLAHAGEEVANDF